MGNVIQRFNNRRASFSVGQAPPEKGSKRDPEEDPGGPGSAASRSSGRNSIVINDIEGKENGEPDIGIKRSKILQLIDAI